MDFVRAHRQKNSKRVSLEMDLIKCEVFKSSAVYTPLPDSDDHEMEVSNAATLLVVTLFL